LDDVRLYLTDLCDDQPTREQFVNGEAADWLTRADTVENTLYALATAPLSNPTRSELSRKNFLSVYALRLDSRLAELRSIAYRAVRVETREVIREVPADCPEARSPEPDRSCNPALKASTRRWFNTLESMTNHVSRSNGAFTVANDLKEEMRGVVWSNDSSDVLSLAVSWERRLSDALDDKTNHEGWFPLSNSERQRFESILTDMRTQLRFCGLHNRRF
jgi:hypothetical protein